MDFIQIGGDVVYDNGLSSCYSCWDLFFDQYEKVCEAHGKIVGLILGVGNHDLGIREDARLLFD